MMIIFASMLYERRIIFTSKQLKRLSACVQSANDIIYPMIWQHIFIPVLPLSLIDYLLAPMPFLIGVPDEVLKVFDKACLSAIGTFQFSFRKYLELKLAKLLFSTQIVTLSRLRLMT